MDRPSFEEGVRLAERLGVEIKNIAGGSPTETMVQGYYTLPPEHRVVELLPMLLRLSREDRQTWDAVSVIGQRELRSGKPLSPELAEWVADVLEGKHKRPAKRGPDRHANLLRDWRVVAAVQVLVDCGFRATRNTEKKGLRDGGKACAAGGSGCDVVGEAIGLGYKAVERIWLACPKPSRERFRNYYPAWGIQRPAEFR